ncbi:MAG: hypothetical protein B6U95_07440 [Thermofilum sp. ex4484_82]|nr:DUF134 domain-containing protein [Thermoproteales archaeon]OYT26480.1 MAG: hypothetical protein B6U95_07440 [Thermofilum sp. ex4484_82]OYT37138.1 MAG: hypothetical protein B6U96_07435 [Archaeoglobales archaeon ex4484_92]RLE75331.1 MAG: hypothetical protein DRJ44_06010 [Thermoprotei archaeon]RLE84825.1 MAG: hypothetical protein DRJ39_02515 [Thermoprotei archaeon]
MQGPWRWCRRRRGRGRPPKFRTIWDKVPYVTFVPFDDRGLPISNEPIYLLPDEYEALRLVYLEGLNQNEAAARMNVSRGTLWRSLNNGRKKIVQALVERRPIVLSEV